MLQKLQGAMKVWEEEWDLEALSGDAADIHVGDAAVYVPSFVHGQLMAAAPEMARTLLDIMQHWGEREGMGERYDRVRDVLDRAGVLVPEEVV